MPALITIAASVGLVAATIIGLLVAGYGLQTLVRLVRHWDTSTPAPTLRAGRIAGMELQLGDATGGTQDALRRLEPRLKYLEVTILRLSERVLTVEQKLLPAPGDERT